MGDRCEVDLLELFGNLLFLDSFDGFYVMQYNNSKWVLRVAYSYLDVDMLGIVQLESSSSSLDIGILLNITLTQLCCHCP